MTITVGLNKPDYVYGVIDGKKKVFSKAVANFDFAREFDVKTARYTTSGKTGVYNAFPYFTSYGTKLIGLYSEGADHAESDRQVMIVSSKSSFGQSYSKTVFYENSTGVYDFSGLDGVLNDGDSLILKSWTIRNTGGVFSATINATVNVSGDDYSMWSPIVSTSGTIYRTGYHYEAGNCNTALFSSVDGGDTWTFKSFIAQGTVANGLLFNEAALAYLGSGKFVAIIRDDSDTHWENALYQSVSTDYGISFSEPELMPEYISGRQPNLTIITGSSTLALVVGKRTGASGCDAGESRYFGDRTGIQLVLTQDGAETWGESTMLDGFYSTDGGQPAAVSHDTGRLYIAYYARKSVDESTDIYAIDLKTLGLEL